MHTHEVGKFRMSIEIAGADLCDVLVSVLSYTKDTLTRSRENENQLTK
jgi:hypothetical protein